MNCYQITLENFTGKVNQCLTPEIYPSGSKGRNHPKMGETTPYLARIFHELLSRDQEDGRANWQPQGVGSEAYLNGTSQGPTPEDARKDGHIHGRSK
jgi:hypothetical protein